MRSLVSSGSRNSDHKVFMPALVLSLAECLTLPLSLAPCLFPHLASGDNKIGLSSFQELCAGQGWGSNIRDFGGLRNESTKDLNKMCGYSRMCWWTPPRTLDVGVTALTLACLPRHL